MLGLNELKQTRVYQEAVQEGKAMIVLRLLGRRFGDLETGLQTKIQQLESHQLEQPADALLDVTNQGDLSACLESHLPTS